MAEGPEYELSRRFADELGVKLKITAVRSYAEIYAALTSGHAHLAAAGLKIPSQNIPGVEFGPAYQRVREHLIYRRAAVRPNSLAEIGSGDLEIAAGSSHAKALYSARDLLPDLVWVENASTDTQALLDGVADGTVDYTIADSTEFALAHDVHPELRIAFDFVGSQSLAWAASARDPGFLHDMSNYFARLNVNGELPAIVKRYYGRSEDLEFVDARVLTQKAGRDPDSWQDVREFLPLLEQEHWYTQTENGYARGWEPVRYVDNVRGYRDLLEWAWGAGGGAGTVALN